MSDPKEYSRLARLAHNEDEVMQFSRGFSRIFLSGYVAPFMNSLMNWTHRWVFNWGLAIVLMTLILKTVTLPFTLAASRSAKRMQKFQPEIAGAQARNTRTTRRSSTRRPSSCSRSTRSIRWAAACRCSSRCRCSSASSDAAEHRRAAVPELPVGSRSFRARHRRRTGFGFPVNIMPLLMGATMIFQMRLTPQPTVDNAQAKMMKFMPILFTFICYGYSCALSLYMTINGLFTIGQQLVINRMKDTSPRRRAAGPAGHEKRDAGQKED